MVSPAFLPSSDGRRYPTRGMGPFSPAYIDGRAGGFPSHELRNNMATKETLDDSASSQRKRIAVACGRCRKRKIRCSGDDGSGQPCTNCKNANHDPCQFLRVASTETPIRTDGLSYTIDLARHAQAQAHAQTQNQARAGAAASMLPVPGVNTYVDGMGLGEGAPYRQSSAYGCHRQYYEVPGYATGYAAEDSGAGFPIYASYAPVQDTNYMVGYRLGSAVAGVKNPGAVYVDAEGYGFSTGPPASQPSGVLQRGLPTAEFQGFAYGGVGMDVQSQAERVTPPGGRRVALPGTAPYLYRSESMSPAYAKHSQGSSASPSSTTSPSSGEHASYGAYDAAGVASSSSTPYSLASPMRSHGDMYTTGSSPAEMLLSHQPASPQRGGAEMAYRYADATRQGGVSMALTSEPNPFVTQGHGHRGHHGAYTGQADHCDASGSDDEMSQGRRGSLRA